MDRLLSAPRGVVVGLAISLGVAGAAGACSSTATTGPAGADAGESDAFTFDAKSNCGHPGDKGNSLGVGQFCINLTDCTENSKARLCTTLGNPENYFCTFRCNATDPAGICGENARCACDPGGSACGCFPTRCDDAPVDAGSDATRDTGADSTTSDAGGDAPTDATGQ